MNSSKLDSRPAALTSATAPIVHTTGLSKFYIARIAEINVESGKRWAAVCRSMVAALSDSAHD